MSEEKKAEASQEQMQGIAHIATAQILQKRNEADPFASLSPNS